MATHELSQRIGSKYSSGRLAWRLAALLMLLVLLSAAAGAVADTLKHPAWVSLWQSLVIGLFAGWALAIVRLPAGRAVVVLALLEMVFLILVPGGLLVNAYGIARELGRLLQDMATHAEAARLQGGALAQMVHGFNATVAAMLERLRLWTGGLRGGQPVVDPLVAGLVWNALMWSAAAWAGWIAESRRNALLAILPAILLGVGVLSYAGKVSWTLHAMLGASLLVLAILQHRRRQWLWDSAGSAYPGGKGWQILGSALLWTVVLATMSRGLSSFSVHGLEEWIADLRKQSGSQDDDLAEALGLPAGRRSSTDALGTARAPGLPRDHLIGAGPELSQRMVMTIKLSGLPAPSPGVPAPNMYWGSFTYDVYASNGWSSSASVRKSYRSGETISPWLPGHQLMLQQQVFAVQDLGGVVYAAGEPVTLSLASEAAWRAPDDLFGVQTRESGAYGALSAIPVADERVLRRAGQSYPRWVRERFLQLPDDLPDRVRALATQLTASESAPYDRVRAIESYLRRYPYTLDVRRVPLQADLVDFFLFEVKEGYCDYYASAMVVLSRAAGVPARFAVGYASGTYNLNSGRFLVSEADAHSWAEVYFPGVGWVPFEPTAPRPIPDRTVPQTGDLSPSPPAEPAGMGPRIPSRLPTELLAGLAVAGILMLGWLALDAVRLRRLPERAAAAEVYHRLRRAGRYLQATETRGDTPFEFARTLAGRVRAISRMAGREALGAQTSRDVDMIAEAIVRVHYGPPSPRTPPVATLWQRLRWRLRLAWLLHFWHLARKNLRRSLG